MSFLLYGAKEELSKLAKAQDLIPVVWQGPALEIKSNNLHDLAAVIAYTAAEYDNSYLLQSCLEQWQKKNHPILPSGALNCLKAETAAHTKEARKYIYLDLLRILYGQRSLNMYGFVHFAAINLKRYYQSLTNRLLRSMKQKEEEEAFVRALKILVEAQRPQIPLARIFLKKDGDFEMLDQEGHDLKDEYIRETEDDEWQKASHEDLMMSILITVVPAKVTISIGECHDAHLPLIRAVFAERLSIVD